MPTPRRLRVVSWNVLHGMDYERGAVDLDLCAKALASLDADVVALQEVDRRQERSGGVDQVAELGARVGMQGVFGPALAGSPEGHWEPLDGADQGGPAYGVGILSRWPIIGHVVRRLPGGGVRREGNPDATPSRPGWDFEPRVALSTNLDIEGRRLRITNVHLSYLPWRGMAQLLAAAQAARRGGGPSVLLGDFNLPRWAVRLGALEYRHAGGEPTFPADGPRVQLDHLLVRGAVKVVDTRVGPRLTSDHMPLAADLLMR